MRTIQVVFCLILLAAINSYGNVSLKWNSTAGGQAQYWNNYPTTPATYANTPANYTLLTYVSGDTTVDFDTSSLMKLSYGSGSGADTFINATNTQFSGRCTTATITTGAAGSGSGSYVGSYAYFILVAMPYSTFAGTYGSDVTQLPAGTLYSLPVLSLVALKQYDTEPPADPGATQIFNSGSVNANIALVPEPSTFALLGIGLGLVGLRRFRRK